MIRPSQIDSPTLDRVLLPLRLARARARGGYVHYLDIQSSVLAEAFDPDFPAGDGAYNGIGQASDGTVYWVISTHRLDAGARLFALDPATSSVTLVANLDAVLQKPQRRAIPQGKVHVDLALIGDQLLGATHIGYYGRDAPSGRRGTASGYAPYPGGWFFSIAGSEVAPLKQAPAGEGIITMTADERRGVVFALSWPRGLLLELDLGSRTLQNHGPVLGAGETGSRGDATWSPICRSLGIDEHTGTVYWSDQHGRVWCRTRGRSEAVASLPRGQIWRKVAWHPVERVFYGVLQKTLFRFDPATMACEEIAMLCAPGAPAALHSTMGFVLPSAGNEIHALAIGPGVISGRQAQIESTVVYLTHDLVSGETRAHGQVQTTEGRWITRTESLLVAGGTAYSVCWAEVPRADRSEHAREIRRHRRHSPEYRFRGYAEELVLVRFPKR